MASIRLLAALAFLANGCTASGRRDPPIANDVSAGRCVAADSTARSPVTTAELAGNYRLTLLATAGGRSGHSTIGSLVLDSRVGHASIALDSVGAVAPGDIGSRDPNAPGVLLLTSTESSDVKPTLRFGADANQSDRRMFDGAYLIFVIDVLTASGFSGRWRSGVNAIRSAGYFCADRVG